MSILITGVLVNDARQDIFISGNRIKKIGPGASKAADTVIDGSRLAAIPSFANAHTHAAMVLMRGYADDLRLDRWLNEKIWPLEAKLTEEDVYWGTRLACLEMIKSGTTFFNDMYWHYHGVARAVEDAGIRALVSAVFIDLFDQRQAREQIEANQRLFEQTGRYSERVMFALGPHAIYTVSPESLRWAGEFAAQHDLMIHIHLSETSKEVEDCLQQHGRRPVEYLHDLGFLGPNVVAAHCVWVDDREIELLKENGVTVVYNPTSNMKLGAGIFPYQRMKAGGLRITLGTDGCASNNNLDMLEEMKFAALLQKVHSGDPAVLPAREAFALATKSFPVFHLPAGELRAGRLADLLLVDLDNIHMTPSHDTLNNLVYAANSHCIDTTICDGKILMRGGVVEDEQEVKARANETVARLMGD